MREHLENECDRAIMLCNVCQCKFVRLKRKEHSCTAGLLDKVRRLEEQVQMKDAELRKKTEEISSLQLAVQMLSENIK